jgi:hypothetical protein
MFFCGMYALWLKSCGPSPARGKGSAPLEHQVVRPSCHYPFPGGEDLDGAAVHHATKGENDGVEREVAAWAVADLVVGDRVEILVNQPGWAAALIRQARGTDILACQGDNREAILGNG